MAASFVASLAEEAIEAAGDTASAIMPRWKRKALAGTSFSAGTGTTGAEAPGAGPTPAAPIGTTLVRARERGSEPLVRSRRARLPHLQGDRFIPTRPAGGFGGGEVVSDDAVAGDGLRRALAASMGAPLAVGGGVVTAEEEAAADAAAGAHRVLAFKTKAPAPPEDHVNTLKVLYTQNREAAAGAGAGAGAAGKVKATRHIPSVPDRILDAPELLDDYYLNLLSWSVNDVLAVALGPSVYLWNAASGAIEELMHTTAADDHVTSVAFIKDGGGYLAIGTASAEVQLWDCERMRQVRCMKGHAARVGALDWNAHLLSSGSRDTSIINHDVRIREHAVATLNGHSQEVCGLKWSPDGAYLASGGNDNTLCIWDGPSCMGGGGGVGGGRIVTPKFSLTDHQAAVKALAWCPWQSGVLATGGGTADRCIKLWNAPTGSLLNSVDTGSQVCALLWNPHERELLSSHGFSRNELTLWKFPSMTKMKELTGHTARVLHMAASPDGSTVVSAGADETLRFWRIFGEARSKAATVSEPAGPSVMAGLALR